MFIQLKRSEQVYMRIQQLLFIVLILVGLAGCSSSRTAGSAGNASKATSPSSRSAGGEAGSGSALNAGNTSTKKGNGKAFQRTHADLVKEAEERQEANAKRRQKEAKMAEDPQYSDPSYFGHKKKPKKRPVGKRKMCKECGIVH
jgi:flagellum-specific peptidoglycan hydrolase FlgJ